MKTPLFALIAAAIIFNIVGCAKRTPGYHLHARFTSVQTLKPNDRVLMAGIQIGYVESITFDPSKGETRVTMHIHPSVVVKTDSTATIISATSPGRCRVDLSSGSPGAAAAVESTIVKTSEGPRSESRTHAHDFSHTRSAERPVLNAGIMNHKTQE